MTPLSRTFRFTAFLLPLFMLSACAETELASHYAKKVVWPGQEASAPSYKIGNPYKIGGVWYYPEENFNLVESGIASWYGPDFHGKKTANGEIYNQNELTAAHRTLPMPSLVRVTNLQNGRSIVVRVNDRGPFSKGRIIDVSKRSAELLGFLGDGTARVRVEVLEKESRKMADAAKRGVNVSRITNEELERLAGSSGKASMVPAPQPRASAVRVASLRNDAEMLPESLRTPTITVEELGAPGAPPQREVAPAQPTSIPGHMSNGKFLPDPVIAQEPVRQTGIFVQAGAFGLRENAERLQRNLSGIAKTIVEPVIVNGRQLYRVKLGPLASVAEADMVLEKVTRAGNGGARVVHD